MSVYQVKNQWGGSDAPWHRGNTWILGGRTNQLVIAVNIKSADHGETLTGTMQYSGEGPIGLRAKNEYANVYTVQVQWGGDDQPWHNDGLWVIGGRDHQRCIQLNVSTSDDGKGLSGKMTYSGEGPIGVQCSLMPTYIVENQWGGSSEPWHNGGIWALSGRSNQDVMAMEITSQDCGKTLTGTMTYQGEGPIGFKGKLVSGNNYEVWNQWGGTPAPWHRAGYMIIGARKNQCVIQLSISSLDDEILTGEMTYYDEGPIGFKASLAKIVEIAK